MAFRDYKLWLAKLVLQAESENSIVPDKGI